MIRPENTSNFILNLAVEHKNFEQHALNDFFALRSFFAMLIIIANNLRQVSSILQLWFARVHIKVHRGKKFLIYLTRVKYF